MSSAKIVCCMQMLTSITNFGIKTKSVYPDQAVPMAVLSGSTLFTTETFQRDQQTTFSRDKQPKSFIISLFLKQFLNTTFQFQYNVVSPFLRKCVIPLFLRRCLISAVRSKPICHIKVLCFHHHFGSAK